MIKILLLILILMSSFAFAQVQQKDVPTAQIFDAFEKAPDSRVKERIHMLLIALDDYPTARGCIINYGSEKEIKKRERQIQKAFTFLKIDAPRITIVRSRGREELATKVYIVPPGAEFPKP